MDIKRAGIAVEPLVEAIDTVLVDLPTIRPHKLAMATMASQTMVIVRMRCSDDLEGLGEATTIGGLSYGVESPEGIQLTVDRYLAPLLIGQPAANINAARARMARYVKGNAFAKSALETALLDAEGKRRNLPVSAVLGGAQHARLPVLWTLASGDAQLDIEEARQMLAERRHREFKLKIGSDAPQRDIRRVADIKAALGDGASVRVDVNQAWDEATARRAIAALADAGVDLIEQPISARNPHGLVRLADRFSVALMADEAVTDATDGVALANAGFTGAVALKLAKAGGLRGALDLAATAAAADIGLYGGTMLEGTIGTAAALHGWATLETLHWGTEMFGPLLLTDDIVTEALAYEDFGVAVPTAPGLGVCIDEDKLEHYRRDGGSGRVSVAAYSIGRGQPSAV